MAKRFLTTAAVIALFGAAVQAQSFGSLHPALQLQAERLPAASTAATSSPRTAAYTYSVSPAPGRVKSLKSFTVTIDGATSVTKGNVSYGNAPRVLDADDNITYCFSMEFSGNTMTVATTKEITAEGKYKLVLPAGFYNIDGTAATEQQEFEYRIGGSDTGIITEQPAGTKVTCYITFLSWFDAGGYLQGMNLEGKPTHYVIGDDGCLYLYNPIIIQPFKGVQTNSYIKGVKDGDEYVFNFPQPISTRIENGVETVQYVNYMKQTDKTYSPASDNKCRFRIDEAGNVVPSPALNDTVEGSGIDNLIGYADADGNWLHYGNYGMTYTKFTPTPHQLPEGVEAQDWTMECYNEGGTKLSADVKVAFRDNEVWAKGLSQKYCPEDWAYGTIADGKVTFDPYLGVSDQVGQYVFLKNNDPTNQHLTLFPLEFAYDPDTKKMTDTMAMTVNPNNRYYYMLEYYIYPVLSDATVELTSRVPKKPETITNFQIMDRNTGRATMQFKYSTENVDGQPLKRSNLYYQMLEPADNDDGFVPYTFTPELFPGLPEAMTFIPYDFQFSNMASTYEGLVNVYFYIPGHDNAGVRMVYKDETGTYYSEPTSWKPFSGVEGIGLDSEPVSTRWYTPQGVRVDASSAPGLYIRVDVFADGTRKVTKTIVTE